MTPLARHSDPDTSHDAAAAVRVSALKARCLEAIQQAPNGLTSEELAQVTGISLVTVSPRLRPLANDGFIYECGRRRNQSGHSAIVWCAAHTQRTLF